MEWPHSLDWFIFFFFLTGKVRRGLCRDGAVDESFFFLLVDWLSTLVYAVSQTSI